MKTLCEKLQIVLICQIRLAFIITVVVVVLLRGGTLEYLQTFYSVSNTSYFS